MYLVEATVKPFDPSGKPLGHKHLTGVFMPRDNMSKGEVILQTKEFLQEKLKEQEPDIDIKFGIIKITKTLQFSINQKVEAEGEQQS